MLEAISYAARTTDERLVCLRIYADANGETHMQDVEMPLLPRVLFKDNPPLRLSDTLAASGIHFCRVPSGSEAGWHKSNRAACLRSGSRARSNSRRATATSAALPREASCWQRTRPAGVTFPAIPVKGSWSHTSTSPSEQARLRLSDSRAPGQSCCTPTR
jgi:hypothetical protein